MNIGIVGLGLIGGSIAKAISKNTEHKVYGTDLSESVVCRARLLEAIEDDLTEERLRECDLVIIAIYPGATVTYVTDNASKLKKGAVVMDCCGVKASVCAPLKAVAEQYGFCFLGAHPMAGVEFSGFAHSKKTLFEKASMILTPFPETDIRILDKVKKLCLEIGFTNVQITTPEEHDLLIAFTSQLAHVVSSAYVKSPSALHHKGFSAGSYKDMTRVATLNEVMWTELFLKNRGNLVSEIDVLIAHLSEYRDAIAQADEERIRELLKEGRIRKAQVDGKK